MARRFATASRCARTEVVVIIDADLEYPPEAIPDLLAASKHHPVVYASRFLAGSRPGCRSFAGSATGAISTIFNLLSASGPRISTPA